MEEGIVVVSCFDGMGCLYIALKELGIKVKRYFAYEIDKHAIKQTQYNFPDITHLGDITKASIKDFEGHKVDLFCGGSPCQGFSFAGKQLNFDDPRSALFFEYVRLWKEIKAINPNAVFLLENVNMKKEYLRVISEYLGVFPVRINSNLVSAQNRDRWYWSNIRTKDVGLFAELWTDIPQPEDKGILLKDILEPNVPEKYYITNPKMIAFVTDEWRLNKKYTQINGEKGLPQLARQYATWCGDFIQMGCVKMGRTDEATTITASSSSVDISDNFVLDTTLKVKANQEKSNCFTAGGNSGGLHSDMDIVCVAMRGRNPENPSDRRTGSPTQQRLEPNTDGKTNCLSTVQKDNLIMQIKAATSRDVEVSFHADGTIRPHRTDYKKSGVSELGTIGHSFSKSCTITSAHEPKIHNNYKLRRLTPTECARLQTIPPWYEWIVSDTQIYKMLGNGWTVEVIKHIFSFLNGFEKTNVGGQKNKLVK